MAQFHFDPGTYVQMIRTEVPDYDTLQAEITHAARRWQGTGAPRVLDLGAGTGATSKAVLDAQPDAQLVLLDENPGMLALARDTIPAAHVEQVIVADLSDPLPDGPFDLVVSALAIHHLDGPAKRALFAHVHDRLAVNGVFAMADVVLPDEPTGAVTPLTPGYDKPDRAEDLLVWLREAGFRVERPWRSSDLSVFVATPEPG